MRHITILTAGLLTSSVLISNTLFAEINTTLDPTPVTQNDSAIPAPQAAINTPGAAAPSKPSPADSNVAKPAPATTNNTSKKTTDDNDPRKKIKNAVVKVHVVKHSYETMSPWNSDSRKGSGSGLLIENNLILTNAHVAANATFIEIQRHGETKRHEAEIVYISHESDLAILRTKDPEIYANIPPLQLGELPKMQQQVEVYGFPIGGATLSVTRGVVSRIEKQDYVHTGENLIAVQVDAAINFGNSGGPVISDGKVVGVAMMSGFLTENIGYMIPTPIIKHVLDDVKDGKVDGYGFHGFMAQSMENPALRRKYGLEEDQTGMLVHKIYENSPADGKVQAGDIVTEIDGHKIENNLSVEFRPGEFIDYTHYIDMHQIGEQLQVKLIRDKQELEVALHLDKPGKEYLLVKPTEYDKPPSFFIFGGFVFMPLNQNVIDSMDGLPARIGALTYESPTEERSEAVVLTKVLPADINKDYHHDGNVLIDKVNGEKFKDFKVFFQKLEAATSDYITLETVDHYQIVIDRKEAINNQPKILARYGITRDRSKDLDTIATATKIMKHPTKVSGQAAPEQPAKVPVSAAETPAPASTAEQAPTPQQASEPATEVQAKPAAPAPATVEAPTAAPENPVQTGEQGR